MLQVFISGASSQAANLANAGFAWWQETACSYPLVQQWIGYCPEPSICRYLPDGFAQSACQIAIDYAAPLTEYLPTATTLVYAITALSFTAASYHAINYQANDAKEKIRQQLTAHFEQGHQTLACADLMHQAGQEMLEKIAEKEKQQLRGRILLRSDCTAQEQARVNQAIQDARARSQKSNPAFSLYKSKQVETKSATLKDGHTQVMAELKEKSASKLL